MYFQKIVRRGACNCESGAVHPALKTHKLHGKLIGLWACQVEYDCRIVFAFEKEPDNEKDLIVLVDIGKHDEVY